MTFSNSTIKAPVRNKPHICIRQGWWRVSPYAAKNYRNRSTSRRDAVRRMFENAHVFVSVKNMGLRPIDWKVS